MPESARGSGPATEPTVFWFRRDLRLTDNPALAAAGVGGRPVLGLFVVDPVLMAPAGAPRKAYLAATLRSLDDAMGGRLVVRSGDPVDVVPAVAAEVGATEVFATDDFGPYGCDRDGAVGEALAEQGMALHLVDAPYAIPPGTVLKDDGTPYKVFTPFYRAWRNVGWCPPGGSAAPAAWIDAPSDGPPPAPELGPDLVLPPAGEAAANERLETFLASAIAVYGDQRDVPSAPATSGLSPHLRWGEIHPRQVLARVGDDPSSETFRKEVAWREFYADVLFHRPDSARTAYVPKMAAMAVDEGPEADARFEAWASGRTGYPIVDAGMRQLLATGWMHNRVRMITASFLVKDLHIDWTRGARWFMRHLVDGDLASNNHGWQWIAGTGTDAAPYFRIFNPVSQGKRFDPDGAYVARWVPELAHLGPKVIHEPWTDPVGPPAGYPAPIVDHATERDQALARYEALKASWA